MTEWVLLTGATGFIGRHLCRELSARGYRVRAAMRQPGALPEGATEAVTVGEITAGTDWSAALRDVAQVVHAAAHVHDARESDASTALHDETNARGTYALAASAASARVRRLVLLSSLKVNGDVSRSRACGPSDSPNPQGAYAVSKWQAEQFVVQICAASAMKYVIVRPPLVYGAGVGGNFLRLMRWIERDVPLPFGAIRNRRSLVNVWNLADLVADTLSNPAAADRTWMVSDGDDLSTADLVRRIAGAMGRRARLFPVPESMLRSAGILYGRRAEISRLCDSLRVDLTQTRSLLGWTPSVTVDAAMARTVDWFRTAG